MGSAKILVADDDPVIRDVLRNILRTFGHDVLTVENGRKAMDVVEKGFDLIILDINMPEMDGFQTLKALNKRELAIPVLFLTGAGSMENAVQALQLGAYDFITKPLTDLSLFRIQINRAIEKRMYVLKDKAYTEHLEAEVQAKTRELMQKAELLARYSRDLETSTLNLILTLQTALEEKDYYTAGHTWRVTQYAMMIAQEMGLTDEEILVLERAAQLHDIGKLVIDNSCIEKKGPLSMEEWVQVRQHPLVGCNIIKHLDFLQREGEIIRSHHERIDGNGYPNHRSGNELNLLTKIITVADSFDAMTSMRAYKQNKNKTEALAELRRCANTQFDPEVVEEFAKVLAVIKSENLPIGLDAPIDPGGAKRA